MSRSRWTLMLAVTAAVLVAAWSLTSAQPRGPAIKPSQLHPADAVAYLQYDGTAAQKPAWEETAAYAALVKSGLWDAAEDWLTALGENEPLAGPIHSLITQVITGGVPQARLDQRCVRGGLFPG
ncbi:MAG: hypothetical protein SH850_10665, partial [Planctomycetaceae bacterium]|nr:hypothetical protein [Planctomycetaceae bacterium]